MSLSNPKTSTNPASKFVRWSGSEGKFYYYDKATETNIELPTPFYIVVLDKLSQIGGYSDKNECGIYSNEVHDLKTEELDVRFQGGQLVAKGLYSNIKANVSAVGGKFIQSVYAALIKSANDLELINIKFTGSSLGPWIEAKSKDDGSVIKLEKDPTPQKKGATTYYQPIVTITKKRDDILENAIAMDKELQAYFGAVPPVAIPEPAPQVKEDIDDDLPF